MNRIVPFILLVLLNTALFAQEIPFKEAQEKANLIVEEGKRLYRAEMASWYGTDLFLEQYKDRSNIGGYFSYTENKISKCIFFNRAKKPKVIGTISFDESYDLKKAKVDLKVRKFTKKEKSLYKIRVVALAEIETDTLFKRYENTNLNIIPLIHNNEKKVYVLTGPQIGGVVIFGNDYLMTFDKKNKVVTKRALHKNIIPIYYKDENRSSVTAMHSHLPETGDFMTATDICTLMLYSKFTNWETHSVFSENYFSSWNCKTNEVNIITMEAMDQIYKDQEKRKKKREAEAAEEENEDH